MTYVFTCIGGVTITHSEFCIIEQLLFIKARWMYGSAKALNLANHGSVQCNICSIAPEHIPTYKEDSMHW